MDVDFNRWCPKCQILVPGGLTGLQEHLKRPDHVAPYLCGQDGCIHEYAYRRNLYVHLRNHHTTPPVPVLRPAAGANAQAHAIAGHGPPLQAVQQQDQLEQLWHEQQEELYDECNEIGGGGDGDDNGSDEDEVTSEDLKQAAELSLLEMRSVNYMTSSALQRVQTQSFTLMEKTALYLKGKVEEFLAKGDGSPAEIHKLLEEFKLDDPFQHVKTKTQQMEVFKEKYGLISPKTICLGEDFDSRLDPHSLQFQPRQVRRTFQYVSIIEILRSILSDAEMRDIIMSEKASNDEYKRSFLDGSIYLTLPDHLKNAIRIVLYVDDLEILQALSASAGIYKVSGFYFGIQNLPPELNALLTVIFVTALAFSDDAKQAGVWEPFLADMRKLEEEGLEIMIDGLPFTFEVVLLALIGDTAAIHEIIGLLAPSAVCFCRACYIQRQEMWRDGLKVGAPRTPEQHSLDVAQVLRRPAERKTTGVLGPPKIDNLKVFKCITHSVFDCFHDLLQGVCKMEIKLALRHYVCIKKYFTEDVLQSRLKFFDYGFPDSKNKPVSKMTAAYLNNTKTYNLHQTGAQMWLLTRAFGFLFGDLVPADDQFMKLISFLNQIMCVVFSRAVTDYDIDNLDILVKEHHSLFQELFPSDENVEVQEETQDTEAELFQDYHGTIDEELLLEDNLNEPEANEESDDQPTASKRQKKAPRKIRFINKHHHLLHYADYIRKFGPMILYWTMRYEARHMFFKLAATVSNNFINPLKSLMDMFQMKLASDRKKNRDPIEIGKRGTRKLTVEECDHSLQLVTAGLQPLSDVQYVKHVKYKGIDYRPELFAMTRLSKFGSYPEFSQIKAIYVFGEKDLLLILQEWKTERFDARVNAYHVTTNTNAPVIAKRPSDIPSPRLLAKWKKYHSLNVYLSPRAIC
ncbi:Zinc finger protein 292 [Frankliniella fusca]|uniref:Zinc finger protein 292 n=1 Tax=Frankliniella fusca TaxID=407009 RepID=A0AAE1HGJ3_9NEOP|nr:Zinc finger protein 292 [Frankliniella fusca]